MATTPTISLQMPPDSLPSPPRMPKEDEERSDGRRRSSSYLSEQKVADMDSTLHLHWDERMKSLGFMTMWYLKVAVLMISWDAPFDDLHTDKEVEDLGNIFRDKYKFDVTSIKLTENLKQNTQVDLNYKLSAFVKENDGEHTLLIVYYAGHGGVGKLGQVELSGYQTPSEFMSTNSVVWDSAEKLLESTHAHVLEILDCCYAGNLGNIRGGSGFCRRSFEFIAAASADHVTSAPGEKSFTHALIWALNSFYHSQENSRKFTINDLVQKIKNCPTFPKAQAPVQFPRNKGRIEGIVLAPLSTDVETLELKRLDAARDIQERASKFFLHLCLVLDKPPTPHELDILAEQMKFARVKDLPLSRVSWVGLRADPAIEFVHRIQRPLRQKSQSPGGGLTPTSTVVKDQQIAQLPVPPLGFPGETVLPLLGASVSDSPSSNLPYSTPQPIEEGASYHIKMLWRCLGANTFDLLPRTLGGTQRFAPYSIPVVLVLGSIVIITRRPFRGLFELLLRL